MSKSAKNGAAKSRVYLKGKNAASLWLFVGVNLTVFLAVVVGSELSYVSVEHFWERVSAKNGIIALCIPLFTIVLSGLLGDEASARLVFWRWKNPLQGCRVFSELIHTDPRINIAALKGKYGAFPRSAKEQNAFWFQLYKKHEDDMTVSEAHRLYLLTRDMTVLSAVFTIMFSAGALVSRGQWGIALAYAGALLAQYVIVATAGRNYGCRFALNVLTEASHAK